MSHNISARYGPCDCGLVYARVFLHAEILQHGEKLLRVANGSQQLGLITNAQHSKVGIKQLQQVLGLGDDVSSRVSLAWCGVDELACVQPFRLHRRIEGPVESGTKHQHECGACQIISAH